VSVLASSCVPVLQANDLFAIMNAVPAITLILYGFLTPTMSGSLCFGAGLGITLFGIAYMFVHDGLVHRWVHSSSSSSCSTHSTAQLPQSEHSAMLELQKAWGAGCIAGTASCVQAAVAAAAAAACLAAVDTIFQLPLLLCRRFPVGPIAELPYMKRVTVAHKLHHSEKYGGVPWGLFLGPQELESIGAGPELDRLVEELEGKSLAPSRR
jgi:hypothetical protein